MRLVCDVPAGRAIERIGVAATMALGTGIVGASSLLVAFAPSFVWLLALRGIGGIGSALFGASLTAFVLGRVPQERIGRAMGTVNGAFLVGSVFGPAVGGVISGLLGLRGPFVLYAATCTVAALLSLTLVRRVAVHAPDSHRRARAPIRLSGGLLAALCATFALWWLVGGYRFELVPLFGRDVLRLSESEIGIGLTVSALVNLIVLWPAGWLIDRLGGRAIGIPAFLMLVGAVFALLQRGGLGGFVFANALYGAAYGVCDVVPGVLLSRSVPKDRAGSAAGLNSLAGDIGAVIGPVAIGASIGTGSYALAAALSGLPAAATALALALSPLWRRDDRQAADEPAVARAR